MSMRLSLFRNTRLTIHDLPREIVVYILTNLPPSEIANCALVNSYWHDLSNDSFLWMTLYESRFCVEIQDNYHRKRIQKKQLQTVVQYSDSLAIPLEDEQKPETPDVQNDADTALTLLPTQDEDVAFFQREYREFKAGIEARLPLYDELDWKTKYKMQLQHEYAFNEFESRTIRIIRNKNIKNTWSASQMLGIISGIIVALPAAMLICTTGFISEHFTFSIIYLIIGIVACLLRVVTTALKTNPKTNSRPVVHAFDLANILTTLWVISFVAIVLMWVLYDVYSRGTVKHCISAGLWLLAFVNFGFKHVARRLQVPDLLFFVLPTMPHIYYPITHFFTW